MKTKVLSILVLMAALVLAMNSGTFAAEQSDHEHNSAFSWFSLVRPLGIATLCCLCATFLTGLFRKKLRARFLKIHLPLAIAAVTLGLTHGLLIFILYG
ncbi:MAG: hypothetical protein ABIF19_00090 [Planctomycetota bacterium]